MLGPGHCKACHSFKNSYCSSCSEVAHVPNGKEGCHLLKAALCSASAECSTVPCKGLLALALGSRLGLARELCWSSCLRSTACSSSFRILLDHANDTLTIMLSYAVLAALLSTECLLSDADALDRRKAVAVTRTTSPSAGSISLLLWLLLQ